MYLSEVREHAHKAAAEAARIVSSRSRESDTAKVFKEVYDDIFDHVMKRLTKDATIES